MSLRRVAMISFHTCPLAALGEGKAWGMNVYVRELSRQLGNMGFGVGFVYSVHPGHEAKVISPTKNVRVIHLEGGPRDESLGTLLTSPRVPRRTLEVFPRERIDLSTCTLPLLAIRVVGKRAAKAWKVPHVVASTRLLRSSR